MGHRLLTRVIRFYLFLFVFLIAACSSASEQSESRARIYGYQHGWQTYENNNLNFAIQYPSSWITEESSWEQFGKDMYLIGFGTEELRRGGMIWGVEVHRKTERYKPDLKDLMDQVGSQFSDRKVEIEKITMHQIDGVLQRVTTALYNDWISKTVFLETGEAIYIISNGAAEDENFDDFYSSFELLEI